MAQNRKGPVIFAPTHRSYIDFILLSLTMLFFNMELPHICAGEDFLNILVVADMLRSSGAFFMRRTFKGDELYKVIFTEYVKMLAKDKQMLEFFIEGTRSRTNKIVTPKYGFLSFLTNCYFDREISDLTIVPITINYMRTLEGETFPLELVGADKVKETLGRIFKAVQILKMSFGSIYMDFCDPITAEEHLRLMNSKG
jgi:glycerone phosphate O-acyltransferase/fatty acyl-CoA reductase